MKHINQRRYSYIPYPQLMDEPDNPYGKKASVKGGGCGLCCACMVVNQLTTEKFSVRESTALSMAVGGNHGDGTDMKIFGPAVAEKFNLDFSMTDDIREAIDALRNGGRVIALVSARYPGNKGIFTWGGHYITLIAADEDEICILDPYWETGKFNKWIKEGLVRVDGKFVYTTPEVLEGERKPDRIGYFIFRRKGAK